MAVNKTLTKRTLVLTLDNGVDAKGKAVTKNFSFSGVKVGSAPEAILAGAHALSDLFQRSLVGINVTEHSMLAGE
jgi:hypothetical protein